MLTNFLVRISSIVYPNPTDALKGVFILLNPMESDRVVVSEVSPLITLRVLLNAQVLSLVTVN